MEDCLSESVHNNNKCRQRKGITRPQAKAEVCTNQVQGLKPRTQPSSPTPDSQSQDLRPGPQLSTAGPTVPQALGLVPRPETCIPQLSPGGVQENPVPQSEAPLRIHGYFVEEYQTIYHSVVDDMLKYKSGRPRPYSLQLGRVIKQHLWERLGHPKVTIGENTGGLLKVEESMGKK